MKEYKVFFIRYKMEKGTDNWKFSFSKQCGYGSTSLEKAKQVLNDDLNIISKYYSDFDVTEYDDEVVVKGISMNDEQVLMMYKIVELNVEKYIRGC